MEKFAQKKLEELKKQEEEARLATGDNSNIAKKMILNVSSRDASKPVSPVLSSPIPQMDGIRDNLADDHDKLIYTMKLWKRYLQTRQLWQELLWYPESGQNHLAMYMTVL